MQINILQNDEDAFLKHHPEAIKKPGDLSRRRYNIHWQTKVCSEKILKTRKILCLATPVIPPTDRKSGQKSYGAKPGNVPQDARYSLQKRNRTAVPAQFRQRAFGIGPEFHRGRKKPIQTPAGLSVTGINSTYPPLVCTTQVSSTNPSPRRVSRARTTGTAFDCLIAVQLRQPPAPYRNSRDLIALFQSGIRSDNCRGAHQATAGH